MGDRRILAWTDGGARGNGLADSIGAWGCLMSYYVGDELIAEKELSGSDKGVTNNQMELQACIELMKAIKDKDIPTTIYFDSKYVQQGLKEWLDNWKRNNWKTSQKKDVKNKEQWVELDNLRNEFTELYLEWVKGHEDDEGNIRVDKLCNIAMDELEKENVCENYVEQSQDNNNINDILDFSNHKYKIYNDDCMNIMKNIPNESIDLIATDPPYPTTKRGISKNTTTGGLVRSELGKQGKIFRHNDIKPSEYIPEFYRILKEGSHCYIMTNHVNLQEILNTATKCGFHFIKSLIWVKDNKIMGQCYMSQFEYILFLRKGRHKKINNCGTSDVLNIPNKKEKTELLDENGEVVIKNGKPQMVNLHDTEKPIELMKILIENSSLENECVFEPFMGIGSTVIASCILNRRVIGVEIDEEYFDISKERLENM